MQIIRNLVISDLIINWDLTFIIRQFVNWEFLILNLENVIIDALFTTLKITLLLFLRIFRTWLRHLITLLNWLSILLITFVADCWYLWNIVFIFWEAIDHKILMLLLSYFSPMLVDLLKIHILIKLFILYYPLSY